jgi:hypothetical protein
MVEAVGVEIRKRDSQISNGWRMPATMAGYDVARVTGHAHANARRTRAQSAIAASWPGSSWIVNWV